MHDPDALYLPATKVRARYDVSDMSLWRWLRDPDLKFPKPIIINRKRFWNLDELEQWERKRAVARAA